MTVSVLLLLIYFSTSRGVEVASSVVANRRPIYNIAHMINSNDIVKEYLNKGANAIESDVTFYRNGTVCCVNHDFPCDCFRECGVREDLAKFLSYIREISTPGEKNFHKEFVLLFLDLKSKDLDFETKRKAGESLAKHLLDYLWNSETSQPQIRVIISIEYSSEEETVKAMLQTLRNAKSQEFIMKWIGWDIGMDTSLAKITSVWSSLNVSGNVWLGSGTLACWSSLDWRYAQFRGRMEAKNHGRFSKLYAWTIDDYDQLQYKLNLGVDSVITNHPERVRDILERPGFKTRLRLATAEDNPWMIYNATPGNNVQN